jgi:hypothetical protein
MFGVETSHNRDAPASLVFEHFGKLLLELGYLSVELLLQRVYLLLHVKLMGGDFGVQLLHQGILVHVGVIMLHNLKIGVTCAHLSHMGACFV